MVNVTQHLIVSVSMDRRHQPTHQTNGIVQRLDQRCQTVGGARSVRDHRVAGLKYIMVDAINNRCVHIFTARCRDNHFLGPTCQVCTGLFFAGKKTGAFHNHVDTKVSPGKFGGIALGQDLDSLTADHKTIIIDTDVFAETAMSGVILQ